MRILMVTEDIPAVQVGGLGKHVVTLANALIAAGHEVELMGNSDLRYEDHAAEIGFHGRFIAGFSLARSGWKESQLGVWMPLKRQTLARRIERAILAHAGDFDVVHYHGHLPLVGQGLPMSMAYLQTRHDQGSECLTHTRFRDSEVCTQLDPSDCAGCRTPAPNRLQVAVSALAVRQYREAVAANFSRRKVVFVSEFLRQQFMRAVPTAELSNSEVLHNFIDLRRLKEVQARTAGEARGPVLLAGRIDDSKGFGRFLECWQQCGGESLDVIGDGAARVPLAQRFSELAVFSGWMPYDDVIARTAVARACVVPSIIEESCATTVLEALALGRPCFALRRGGTPELKVYERYPGQLQLADSMFELATMLKSLGNHVAPALPPASVFAADISLLLPRLTGMYQRVQAQTLGD